jgi:hypothetical protein
LLPTLCRDSPCLPGSGGASTATVEEDRAPTTPAQHIVPEALASFTGLVGAPFASGDTHRDQGITKAGSKWVRSVIIEVAWMWLRYQPQSALSQWYFRRFGGPGKRLRKIGIVALARKLVVALWRYLEKGIPPEGAILVPWYTKAGLRKPPAVAA